MWSDYKRARNKATSDLRRAKTLYFSKMFKEVESLSAYWKVLKDATSSRVRKPIGPLRKPDDSLVSNDKEKAGLVNWFFATIGKAIATKLPTPSGNATRGAFSIHQISGLQFSRVLIGSRNSKYPWILALFCNGIQYGFSFRDTLERQNFSGK